MFAWKVTFDRPPADHLRKCTELIIQITQQCTKITLLSFIQPIMTYFAI